jgi:hypothetical protein
MERTSPTIAELLAMPHPVSLGPGSPNRAAGDRLRELDENKLFAPQTIRDTEMARACLAGLWLRFDYLDDSHRLSQELHSPEGSFWHAIMHRREPDAGNSKYWWRRVGSHPVIDELSARALSIGYAYVDPSAFVDFCERVRGTGAPDEHLAEQVQVLEWDLLFEHCRRGAIGA